MLRFKYARIGGTRVKSTLGRLIRQTNDDAINWLDSGRVLYPHHPDPLHLPQGIAVCSSCSLWSDAGESQLQMNDVADPQCSGEDWEQ